jgi:outer membrane protein assembly factor BamE (lipoprotein component of BamABCDE complex)
MRRRVHQHPLRCQGEIKTDMKRSHQRFPSALPRLRAGCLGVLLALALAGCDSFSETLQRGYVLQDGALEQIPVGATQEQVLIVLGTPSTVATVSGEAFYYISQRSHRDMAFMPHEVIDQRVIAVYFDKDRRVEKLANYGLKDGKVFDFVTQTTKTGGQELNYLRNLLKTFSPKMMTE